jgi:hypothetical protein
MVSTVLIVVALALVLAGLLVWMQRRRRAGHVIASRKHRGSP